MRRDVVSVTPDLPVAALVQLMEARHITGAPVIDRDGQLVGMVSVGDLSQWLRSGPAPAAETAAASGSGTLFQEEVGKTARVEDVMTRSAVAVREDAPVLDALEIMLQFKIRRLVVQGPTQISGIVTAMDILRRLRERRDAIGTLQVPPHSLNCHISFNFNFNQEYYFIILPPFGDAPLPEPSTLTFWGSEDPRRRFDCVTISPNLNRHCS